MLSAGFATITYLKSRLLPEADTDETDHDADIAALGKSVAGKFNQRCGRSFDRAENAQDVFGARQFAWTVTRYPVESIASVEIRSADGTLSELEAGRWSIHEASGVLETDSYASLERRAQIVITYSGGYWLNPQDGTAKPAEADALPDDVLEAWVSQCQHEAECRGLFGAKIYRKQKDQGAPKTGDLGLLEDVIETLNPHRRFGMA